MTNLLFPEPTAPAPKQNTVPMNRKQRRAAASRARKAHNRK